MAYVLRPYQQAAVDDTLAYLFNDPIQGRAPVLVAPTGSGKSLLVAELCKRLILEHGVERVLVITHVKELVEQNLEKLEAMLEGVVDDIGVHSAGLRRRDTQQRIVVGGVQSLVRRIKSLGSFEAIIVDEAHRVPTDHRSQYQQVLRGIPHRILIGLTATPYRSDNGYIYETFDASYPPVFDGVGADVKVVPLIREGYLANLRPIETDFTYETEGCKKQGGDFVMTGLLADRLEDEDNLQRVVNQWLVAAADRKSTLVFAATIEQAQRVLARFVDAKKRATIITGDTPIRHRDASIAQLRSGELDVLVNVMVLTTGFDAPIIDCIVCLRPTQSTSLYVQIMGRGMRTNPGKTDCLVLDYGGNVARHGPLAAVRPSIVDMAAGDGSNPCPVFACPKCSSLVPISSTSCEFCGFVFPRSEPSLLPSALSIVEVDLEQYAEVKHMHVRTHLATSGSRCIRIDFNVRDNGVPRRATSYYVIDPCPGKKSTLWRLHKDCGKRVAGTCEEIIAAFRDGIISCPTHVLLQQNGSFLNVETWHWEPGGRRALTVQPT
jgi:DNA repair protein RadD